MSKIEELVEKLPDLSDSKREFLIELLEEAKQVHSKEEILILLKKMKKESKQKNIELSKDEAMLLISIIRQGASEEEKQKIDKVLK